MPLFEDYNIPRAVRHAISSEDDVEVVAHLYRGPDASSRRWFAERMDAVRRFAASQGVAVQAWSAFGMDAAVWLAGVEGAVMLALDRPGRFRNLMDIIDRCDGARTALAAADPGIDVIVQRGWYSGTDFWSPALFDEFTAEGIRSNAAIAHSYGKKFAYVLTTGVEVLGPRLADLGVDILYFVDPVQDGVDLGRIRRSLGTRMTLVGGTNALSLSAANSRWLEEEIRRAVDTLGPGGRFVLHPVDAIFPDTPVDGVKRLVDAWSKIR